MCLAHLSGGDSPLRAASRALHSHHLGFARCHGSGSGGRVPEAYSKCRKRKITLLMRNFHDNDRFDFFTAEENKWRYTYLGPIGRSLGFGVN